MKKQQKQDYTHFTSIPFIRQQHKYRIDDLQQHIFQVFKQRNLHGYLHLNSANLLHFTLFMLRLPDQTARINMCNLMESYKVEFGNLMRNRKVTAGEIRYFSWQSKEDKYPNISVLYLDIAKDQTFNRLAIITDKLVKSCLQHKILQQQDLPAMYIRYDNTKNQYYKQDMHVTLFYCKNLWGNDDFWQCYAKVRNAHAGKVMEVDYVDVSTRWQYDQTKFYKPLYRLKLGQQKQYERREQIQMSQQDCR